MNRQTHFIIEAILQLSNQKKQIVGQRIAYRLGLNPGPRGSDDGVDGFLLEGGQLIHFQSKLKKDKLDREDARSYASDIIYHRAKISIILSGRGFKSTFIQRLFGHEYLQNVDVHLLELKDIFEENENFIRACSVLPELRRLDNEIKKILD